MSNKIEISEGDRLSLDGNTIYVESYEMTDYHKRDYGYVRGKEKYEFADEKTAKRFFSILNRAYIGGVSHGANHVKKNLEKSLSDFKDSIKDI